MHLLRILDQLELQETPWLNHKAARSRDICEKSQYEGIKEKNLPCMYTNGEALTNKMPESKAYVEHHNHWIITITEIIPKHCWIFVQKAELKISNNYDIFPECISSKGTGITIQTYKDLGAQEVSSWVSNLRNVLPAEVVEVHTLSLFEKRLDATLKAHEWNF